MLKNKINAKPLCDNDNNNESISSNDEKLEKVKNNNKKVETKQVPNKEVIEYKKNNKKYVKDKIPQDLRIQVWRKSCGYFIDGRCFVCNNEINILSFECGHETAETNGGKTILSNLHAVCGGCNKKMAKKNLLEYKEKNFGDSKLSTHFKKYGQKCPLCMNIVDNPKDNLKKITNGFFICTCCNEFYIDKEIQPYLELVNNFDYCFDKNNKSLVSIINRYIDSKVIDFEQLVNMDINFMSMCHLFYIFENESQDFTNEYLCFCMHFLIDSYKYRNNDFIKKLIYIFENRLYHWGTCKMGQKYNIILPIYIYIFLFKNTEVDKLRSLEIWEHQFRKHNIYGQKNQINFVIETLAFYYSGCKHVGLIDENIDFFECTNFLGLSNIYLERIVKFDSQDIPIRSLFFKYLMKRKKEKYLCPVLCKLCENNGKQWGETCQHNGFIGCINFCRIAECVGKTVDSIKYRNFNMMSTYNTKIMPKNKITNKNNTKSESQNNNDNNNKFVDMLKNIQP